MSKTPDNKKRILVIDDEEILTRTFSKLLEKQGYEVFVAKNGGDALAMVEVETFDLIISDIRMPGKNGVDVIKAVQDFMDANQKRRVPVIFITGFADDQVEKKARELGPVAYLFKPFDVRELIDVVSSAV